VTIPLTHCHALAGFPRESNHSADTAAINSLIDFIENKLGAHTVNAISVALNCSLLSQDNFPAALRTPLFFAAFSEYCKKCITPIDALLKAPSVPSRTSPVAPGPAIATTATVATADAEAISPTVRSERACVFFFFQVSVFISLDFFFRLDQSFADPLM
jgi:hypothetical protein